MKKLYALILLAGIAVFMLAACGKDDTSPEPQEPQESPDVNINAEPPPPAEPLPRDDISSITVLYSRIDWRDNMESTTIIRSVDELREYYEELAAVNMNDLDDDLIWRFTGEKYNNGFFADNFLVLITVSEISGSNRHAVSSIEEDNNVLKISIDREVPEIGTADMAGWLIIIELTGNYSVTEADVFFTDVPVRG